MKPDPEHPSHGLALFSVATSNGSPLFGSPLHTHYTIVRLQISGARIINEEGDGDTERYLPGEEYIEVQFSAQQFGELISRQNIMPGIPCTIRRHNGHAIEAPPPRHTNQSKINSDFKAKIRKLFKELGTKHAEVEQVLSKKTIGVRDREQIRGVFEHFRRHIEQNLPFAIEMFTEATHDTVAAARQEVAVALRTALQMAGIDNFGKKPLLPPAEQPTHQLKETNEDAKPDDNS